MARKPKKKSGDQIDRFRKAAREHGADEDEGKFNDALRRVAKTSPKSSEKSRRSGA